MKPGPLHIHRNLTLSEDFLPNVLEAIIRNGIVKIEKGIKLILFT